MVYWYHGGSFKLYHSAQVPEQNDVWGGTYVCTRLFMIAYFS